MNITIRQLQGQEMFDAFYTLGQYCFHSSPPFENREEWMERVSTRGHATCFAACEGEKPVTIVSSSAMTQNMRGALYPASGVWGVSSLPAARRKGYVRQAMASLLAAERETGKVFTNLYPFRESFYERLGYVTFPLLKIARFSPQNLAPLLKRDLEGEIELKTLVDTYETYRQYLMELRQEHHGMAVFDAGDLARAKRNNVWVAAARFDGKIEGMMLYALQGEHATSFNFIASRFYYQTSRARYLLLDWIARHIDQADRVEIWLAADETPETWLADMQLRIESPNRAAMSRVLDVARIGGMNVGNGSFTAQVIDSLCPWNEGAWRFEASDGKLLVTKATGADCELTIQGLSALVAGTHDPEDFPLRGWGSPSSMVQDVQRKMFIKLSPHLHENF